MNFNPWIYKAKILKVSDGDSWWMEIDRGFKDYSHKNVRLWYYNMPETKLYAGVTPEEKELGLKAKARAEELMPVGSEVMLVTHKDETGKYGRLLAEVYYRGQDGSWLDYGDTMITEGHVWSYYDENGTEILVND